MSEKITRYYDETKNPEGGSLPGVPLRDLLEREYAALPEWLQHSIDALPCYRKTKPAVAALASSDDATDGRKDT